MSLPQNRSGLKRFCLWLHHCSSPPPSPPPLPVSCSVPRSHPVSRGLPLLVVLLLCSLLLMLLLLLWNYHCLFISHICSLPGEEEGEGGDVTRPMSLTSRPPGPGLNWS
ncbi:uncharacterized [Lates japonicus]